VRASQQRKAHAEARPALQSRREGASILPRSERPPGLRTGIGHEGRHRPRSSRMEPAVWFPFAPSTSTTFGGRPAHADAGHSDALTTTRAISSRTTSTRSAVRRPRADDALIATLPRTSRVDDDHAALLLPFRTGTTLCRDHPLLDEPAVASSGTRSRSPDPRYAKRRSSLRLSARDVAQTYRAAVRLLLRWLKRLS
jgi:hypothetical protein